MFTIFTAAAITFTSALLLFGYFGKRTMRRIAGQYRMRVDIGLHLAIIFMFMGTMGGLLQAEAAGIGVTLFFRWYGKHRGKSYKRWRHFVIEDDSRNCVRVFVSESGARGWFARNRGTLKAVKHTVVKRKCWVSM